MSIGLKRILITVSTLAVSAGSFAGAQQTLAQKSSSSPTVSATSASNSSPVQDTASLEMKVSQLHNQIVAAQNQLQQVQSVDKQTTDNLTQLASKVVVMKQQETAALARAQQTAAQAAASARQNASVPPNVQATTRASGHHHDDDGGGGGDD